MADLKGSACETARGNTQERALRSISQFHLYSLPQHIMWIPVTFVAFFTLFTWYVAVPIFNSFPGRRWPARPPKGGEIPPSSTVPKDGSTTSPFIFEEAFDRTIGFVTPAELQALRRSRVAIGGLGGVGGSHAITLARLGVSRFTISDMDEFDWPNMNRQAGCLASTIGKPKCETLASVLADINPEVQLTLLPHGVDDSSLDKFLEGVDLYVDSYDVFALDIRRKTFKRCRELGIPAITCLPVGFGASFAAFLPGGISFEEYCDFASASSFEGEVMQFLIAICPPATALSYIVDRSRMNVYTKQTASTSVGIQMAAGVVGANAVKILLGRGDVISAPTTVHFDAYLNKMQLAWRPFGNRNPLQKFSLWLASWMINNVPVPVK